MEKILIHRMVNEDFWQIAPKKDIEVETDQQIHFCQSFLSVPSNAFRST